MQTVNLKIKKLQSIGLKKYILEAGMLSRTLYNDEIKRDGFGPAIKLFFIEGYWTDSSSSQYSQVRYKSNNYNFIFFNWQLNMFDYKRYR